MAVEIMSKLINNIIPFSLFIYSCSALIVFELFSIGIINPYFYIFTIVVFSILYECNSVKPRFFFTPLGVVILLCLLYFPVNYLILPKTNYSEYSLILGALSLSAILMSGIFVLSFFKSENKELIEFRESDLVKIKVVYFIGVFGTISSIITGNFFGQYDVSNKYLSPVLGALVNLRFLGFAGLVAILSFNSKKNKLVMFLFLIEVGFAFLTTSKQLIIYPILVILMCREYSGNKVSKINIFIVSIVVLFLFSITYAVRNIWYTYLGQAEVSISDILELAMAIPSALTSLTFDDYFKLLESVVTRFHGIHSLNLIMENGRPLGYENYQGLSYAISLIVPRLIWPDKPDADYQIMFGYEFYGIEPSMRVLIPPTQVGVAYLDYGIAGVIIISSVLGIIGAYLNISFSRIGKGMSSTKLLLIFYLFVQFTKIEAHPFEILSSVVKNAMLIGFILYIITSKYKVR
ncbi:TPA: hypothetical protein I7136_10280 [Vibrio vulnificus]|nr:hypothetical protein [Vibrio vulnificus]